MRVEKAYRELVDCDGDVSGSKRWNGMALCSDNARARRSVRAECGWEKKRVFCRAAWVCGDGNKHANALDNLRETIVLYVRMVAAQTAYERLVISASRLFASDGVGATSIRAIIKDAGVNLNAIHYHFGSRRGLLGAVWKREIAPITLERGRALEGIAPTPGVREVLDALYRPVLSRGRMPPASAGARGLLVLQQIRQDPSEDARAVLAAHEETLAPVFNSALARCLNCKHRAIAPLIVFVNGAAWDAAAQTILAAQVGVSLALDLERFLDLASAGLRGAIGGKDR